MTCDTSGDKVKLDTRPVAYGKAMYFIKKAKPTELDEIIYCRLPEEVYGDAMEARPVMRLVGKPDSLIRAILESSPEVLMQE